MTLHRYLLYPAFRQKSPGTAPGLYLVLRLNVARNYLQHFLLLQHFVDFFAGAFLATFFLATAISYLLSGILEPLP